MDKGEETGTNKHLKTLFQQILGHLQLNTNKEISAGLHSDPNKPNERTIEIFKNIKNETLTSDEQNYQYYLEYCNIFVANVILLEKVKETIDQKEELIFKLKRLQKNMSKRRRYRRKADEIVRAFKCPIPKCEKSYGSEGSLQQHLKQKHRKYFAKYCAQLNKIESSKEEDMCK